MEARTFLHLTIRLGGANAYETRQQVVILTVHSTWDVITQKQYMQLRIKQSTFIHKVAQPRAIQPVKF
jgi:hypothetical protein